jgi:hypothetical protein
MARLPLVVYPRSRGSLPRGVAVGLSYSYLHKSPLPPSLPPHLDSLLAAYPACPTQRPRLLAGRLVLGLSPSEESYRQGRTARASRFIP